MQILIFIFLILFRIILCGSYWTSFYFGAGEKKIYAQFVNDDFVSASFYCDPYKQINKTISRCTYNESSEVICHPPKVQITGRCFHPCEMYITSNNSIINNTFVPTNILEHMVATKVHTNSIPPPFQFYTSILETDFYIYVINQDLERGNMLEIFYSCVMLSRSFVMQDDMLWRIILTGILVGGFLMFCFCGMSIYIIIVFDRDTKKLFLGFELEDLSNK